MGASTSKSSMDIVADSITKATVEIVQSSINSNSNEITFTVENVDGDVTISNLDVEQIANISGTHISEQINNQNIAQKINNEIAQQSKSLLSGLNIGQISTSINDLNNYIRNCLIIKNSVISKCINKNIQKLQFKVKNVKGNVLFNNDSIKQNSNNLFYCGMNSSNISSLISENDSKLKQKTESKAEGLDFKLIAIFIVLGMGGFTLGGTMLISSLLGPGLFIAGIASLSYGIFNLNKQYTNKIIYIDENEIVGKVVKKEFFKKDDDVSKYGIADVYQLYKYQLTLFNNVSSFGTETDFSKFVFSLQNRKDLNVFYKTNSKYNTLLTLPSEYDKLIEIYKKEDVKNVKNVIYLDREIFNTTHELILYSFDENNLSVHNLDIIYPHIIYQKTPIKFTNFIQNYFCSIGLSCCVIGLIIILQKSLSNDKKKYKKLE